MQVFKLYYKVLLRAMIATILMYVVIFSVITISFTNSGTSPLESAFNVEKSRVAIIDNDRSDLSEKLSQYIGSNCKIFNLNDYDKNNLRDLLFFRRVDYICTIPQGFEDKFFDEETIDLETMRIPDSSSSQMVDTLINKYLNTIRLYVNGENISIEEASTKAISDLKIDTNVSLNGVLASKDIDDTTQSTMVYFFNYYAYPLLAILVMCITNMSLILNKEDMVKRNSCSPISISKLSMQTLFGHITMALFIFVVFYIMGGIINKDCIFTKAGLLIGLNAFIFTIVCLSLSYMLSLLVKNSTVAMISNTVSLGSCFLGGVFVPQSLLSDTVKNISLINPTFWYIKANNTIGGIAVYNSETMRPVVFALVVEICFAVVFLGISLVLLKKKRTAE